jgi:hypothetical protein
MNWRIIPAFLLYSISLVAQKPYFQQRVDYQIKVALNDIDHSLTGDIQIIYKNNSPDVLDKIGIHLWPNAYQNKNTAFAKQKIKHRDTKFYDAKEHELGFIDQLDFKVNNEKAQLVYVKENPDMAWLSLTQPLRPGDSILINTPFHIKLPESFSRLGHAGQTYQITQWYPKPAVYDHKGWHLMPYLDQGEFYSEFGNFDVQITLPKNYVVGATGSLQNADELKFLDEKIRETKEIIAQNKNVLSNTPLSDPEFKTLRYLAENVHDFAWFADKTFFVQKAQAILNSGKKVDVWTMFNDITMWDESAGYVKRAVEFYSQHVGEYPWPQATAVESALSAGGGMEYPMITVIGSAGDKQGLDQVITHEVGHNWFYGILASNERDHPYMDEGINSYYERRYMKTYYPPSDPIALPGIMKSQLKSQSMDQMLYLTFARSYGDQHPNQHSENFRYINYGNDVYFKTAHLFAYMEKSLGTAKFDQIMSRYYNTWKFKHPYPEDLQKIFSEQSPSNPGWLFDGFLNTDRKMDYGFCNVKSNENEFTLKIYNRGSIPAPFTITGIKDGKVVEEKWINGFRGTSKIAYPKGDYDLIAIDYKHESYDLYDYNNYIRTKGIFKKLEPIHLSLLPVIDQNGKTDIGITPVVGSNLYNGFMLGAFISGPWFPYKNFSFNVMPMYGFRNKQLAGQLSLRYTLFFKDLGFTERFFDKIKSISFMYNLKSYAYNKFRDDTYLDYFQTNTGIKIEFNHLASSFKTSELSYTESMIRDEFITFFDTIPFFPKIDRVDHNIKYKFTQISILGDFGLEANINWLNQKMSSGEKHKLIRMQLALDKSFRYKPNRYFKTRFYLAYYPLNSERNSTSISSRSAPGFVRGSTGLAYQNYLDDINEDLFLGRSEVDGLWSQQIFLKQGGFKLATGAPQRNNLGNTNDFLCSVNLSMDLPFKYIGKFVRPYFDIGYFEHPDLSGTDKFMYSGGINLSVVPGFFDIYFPIVHSQNIRDIYKYNSDHTYWKEVTFSIKLRKPGMNDLLRMVGY